MRQVPYHYAIIGNGRVANHVQHYFNLLHIPFSHWHRQASHLLTATVKDATHILLLIKDSAIETFIAANDCLAGKIIVHFSGCHLSQQAYGAHPLMTFSSTLYPLPHYLKIPFIIGQNELAFAELLPGVPNPHYAIPCELKTYYHSLCVMANNFTTLLWQKFFADLSTKLQIPTAAALPFLEQTLLNLRTEPQQALTGPLARNDQVTLNNNLQALANDPFQQVYAAFIRAYEQSNRGK